MENIKDALENFYKIVNPDNIDYNLNENRDANKIREIRNAFYEEVYKYQKMLDELIIKENNVDVYMNQYVCISNESSYGFDEVCEWYKQTDLTDGIFEAIGYDSKQNITSYKKIYIDFLGRLYFEFEQIHRKPVRKV